MATLILFSKRKRDMMPRHKFTSTLERPDAGGAWTFICVPLNIEDVFGTRARVAVKGDINGTAFRSSLLPQRDGVHILVVNKSIRT
jgi:hypothetical protein